GAGGRPARPLGAGPRPTGPPRHVAESHEPPAAPRAPEEIEPLREPTPRRDGGDGEAPRPRFEEFSLFDLGEGGGGETVRSGGRRRRRRRRGRRRHREPPAVAGGSGARGECQ